MTSEAFADLGGQRGASKRPEIPGHRHRNEDGSHWCRCGARDDGLLAEGSPAWRYARAVHA